MKLAIVGATGKVGRMMLTNLKEFEIKFDQLDLYASINSAGKEIIFDKKKYIVNELTQEAMKKGYDYLLFSAGGQISREYAPIAAESGATIIDNSSAFRTDPNIPLIVPEINIHLVKSYKGIISNPNCSTIQLVLLLKPLNDYCPIKKVIVTTMQSVSGSGYKGILEMQSQRQGNKHVNLYPKQIDLNVIPQIGGILDDGFCEEERKMTLETRKILGNPDFNLVATTVRVPVVYGHSESVYIEFRNAISLAEITKILSNSPAVEYKNVLFTPLDLEESNLSHVSRLRYAGDEKSIFLWNVGHNVRLGAATNAVKILKLCSQKRT